MRYLLWLPLRPTTNAGRPVISPTTSTHQYKIHRWGTIISYVALFAAIIPIAILTSEPPRTRPNNQTYASPTSTPVPKLTKQQKQLAEDKRCLRDASCAAKRSDWKIDGFPKCFRQIEDQALFDYDWTAGVNSRFDEVVIQINGKAVRYLGDQVRFQNEYGAWRRMAYDCLYDPINERVIDVSVVPYH